MRRARTRTHGGRILIDGGQTGTRARIETACGSVEEVLDPIRTDRSVVEQVAAAVRTLRPPDSVTVLAAGLSGLTPDAARPDQLRDLLAPSGIEAVTLAHDSVTAYLGANGLDLGVVTAVGTGVVTLGVGRSGVCRVDGWGHLFGDAGSAYWIGRAGLDAALRAFDGRGPSTVLEKSATTTFGPLPELYMTIQADPDRVARVAGFAPTVDEAATAGDAVAGRIVYEAADELARSVLTALRRSGHRPGEGARVSWTGTVISHNERLRARVVRTVSDASPGVEIGPPRGSPLDGVGLLRDLHDDHPLAAHVHVSSP